VSGCGSSESEGVKEKKGSEGKGSEGKGEQVAKINARSE
jgi:hypothetical protein